MEVDAGGIRLPGDPGADPAAARRADALRLRRDLAVRAVPHDGRRRADLLELAGRLAEPAPLTEAARRLLAPWLERIEPAVHDFAVSEMSEEYIVFQLGGRRPGWLEHRADWIAGLVRLESGPLSRGEVREATRLGLSYTPNDLVVLDWAAGVRRRHRLRRYACR